MAVLIQPANAVHDTGAFELDGNATNDGAVTGDDWDNVCHEVKGSDCSTSSNTTGATGVAWAEDAVNGSIFTGGGSKDPIDIPSWRWKDGSVPDKDNLLHSFAARYSLPPTDTSPPPADPGHCPSNGEPTCEVLYFGSDRFDNSGDAQQGFWFFQSKVLLGSTKSGGGTIFVDQNGDPAKHSDGDVLVISDFSNGGTTSTISVYKWNSAVAGNLEFLGGSTSANCATAGAHDQFCGVVSGAGLTDSPWTFKDKSGNTKFANGELYEGGINLSTLGLGSECFSSVASETRSSTATTATLKDFVLAQLGECGADLTTTPKDGNGDAIAEGGLVLGSDGTVDATDSAQLDVHGITTWSGTLTFFICGPIDPTATVQNCPGDDPSTPANEAQGTQVGDPINVDQDTAMPQSSDATTLSDLGHYCWRGEFVPDQATKDRGLTGATDDTTGECFDVTAVPTITTTRQFTFPQDAAQITAAAGGDLAGSVHFRLYDTSANCTAATDSDVVGDTSGLQYDENNVAVSGASPQVVTTTNTSFRVDASTTADLYWRVDYTSTGNGSQLDSYSHCDEYVGITFGGDDSEITLPTIP